MCNHNELIELYCYTLDDWNYKQRVRFEEVNGDEKVICSCKNCGQVFCKNMNEVYNN